MLDAALEVASRSIFQSSNLGIGDDSCVGL